MLCQITCASAHIPPIYAHRFCTATKKAKKSYTQSFHQSNCLTTACGFCFTILKSVTQITCTHYYITSSITSSPYRRNNRPTIRGRVLIFINYCMAKIKSVCTCMLHSPWLFHHSATGCMFDWRFLVQLVCRHLLFLLW